MRNASAGWVRTGVGALAVAALALAASAGASARPASFVPTVVMTVTDTTLNFRPVAGLEPATVPDGRLSFRLDNRAHTWRTFSIADATSARIAPGKSGTITVRLPTAGQYYYTVGAADQTRSVEGIVKTVDACTNPRSTTVYVKLVEAPLAATPNHIHCGTVTFVLKNTEKGNDSFAVSLPNTTEPAPESPTGEIAGGKTIRVKVQFRYKGIVTFGSNEPFRNTQFNEYGALAIL